jgi:hypothetical protein
MWACGYRPHAACPTKFERFNAVTSTRNLEE